MTKSEGEGETVVGTWNVARQGGGSGLQKGIGSSDSKRPQGKLSRPREGFPSGDVKRDLERGKRGDPDKFGSRLINQRGSVGGSGGMNEVTQVVRKGRHSRETLNLKETRERWGARVSGWMKYQEKLRPYGKRNKWFKKLQRKMGKEGPMKGGKSS